MTDRVMQQNYTLIKYVFQFLQAKSKAFPYVDNYAFFEYFIKPAQIFKHNTVKRVDIEILLIQARVDDREEV
jgi:hypothetical protein